MEATVLEDHRNVIFDGTLKSEPCNFSAVARRHNGEKAVHTSKAGKLPHEFKSHEG